MTSAALFLAWVLSDPPLGDAARLPPVAEIRAAIDFNQRCQRRLDWLIDYEPYGSPHRATVRRMIDEIEWVRFNVLDAAWGCHPQYTCSPEAKQVYLRRLRLALGRDAYGRMDLGPAVPGWYFRELR